MKGPRLALIVTAGGFASTLSLLLAGTAHAQAPVLRRLPPRTLPAPAPPVTGPEQAPPPLPTTPPRQRRLPSLQPLTLEKEVVPPPSVAVYANPGSVTLKAGSTSEVLQVLTVKRRFPIATLRANPSIKLGTATADMSPVFGNPAALANVASRLRSQPALAQVLSDDLEVLEVDQGLIVRQFLSYQFKPDVCSSRERRAILTNSGVGCFSRMTVESRAAAFADPGDPHYVANSLNRSRAIALAVKESTAEKAAIASDLAQLRTMMADPVQRAQIDAAVGAAEAARLASLSDDQLEAELVNSGVTQIEETMFVSATDKVDSAAPATGRHVPSKIHPDENVDFERQLDQHIYLAGFSLGRENEWRKRVSVTIKWCIVGCKKTYFVEAYAGFGYGFGLRFPIRVGGLYAYHRISGQESATVAPAFVPIDGSESDYAESGLPGDQIFRGKELVAELFARAGFDFKVPFYSDGFKHEEGADYTESLPAPFTNGQFTPPAAGASNALAREAIFDEPDLLGGLANYGVVGAQVLPAVKFGLSSDFLRMTLRDNISGKETEMASSGQTYPLAIDPKDHSSHFSIGYPKYNVAFFATPGLAARLFVDVSVWSDHWDWPVWFPQLTVTLPPDGLTFTCHANTVCSRVYNFSSTEQIEAVDEMAPSPDPGAHFAQDWAHAFKLQWHPECPNEPANTCIVSIDAIAAATAALVRAKFPIDHPNLAYSNSISLPNIYPYETDAAREKAGQAVSAAKLRDIERYAQSLVGLYEPVWGSDCADQICRDRIHAIGGEFVVAMVNRQKANLSLARDQVQSEVNAQGHWTDRAAQEVAASKTRARGLLPIRRTRGPAIP